MTKYAVLFYNMDGVYHYIPLIREGGTYEQAVEAALEYISDGEVAHDDGDLRFQIVEIAKEHNLNTADHQNYFEKKVAEARKRQQEQYERNEKEQFERLKKKFGNK